MFKIIYTRSFDKDALRCAKKSLEISLLQDVNDHLEKDGTVPAKHRPHILSGNLQGYWECHVKADWLLIWNKNESQKTIILIGTGSHSDLF